MARRDLDGIKALSWLEGMGYRLSIGENSLIAYSRHAEWPLDPVTVRPYLEAIKANKATVANFLQDRQAKHGAWLATYEAWEVDPDPVNDAQHKQWIAGAAGAAGLPFYEDGEADSGLDGWTRWSEGSGKRL